ncbi:M56 family metallopeptidase [Clostridiaceae bacterium M8S5]|nr:M56 family metallopeptidase [Clostridiaceae bacterium M8S5]
MEFFKWILIASEISSIMAIIIFLVKSLFKDKLGVTWNYYIWFLLLIRLIIPPNFVESSLSIFNSIPVEIRTEISLADAYNHRTNDFLYHRTYDEVEIPPERRFNKSENIERDIGSTVNTEQSKIKTISNNLTMGINNKYSIFKIAYILWIIGVIILTAYTIYANIKLYLKINMSRITTDEKLNEILVKSKKKMTINKMVKLIVINEVKSAAIFGLFKPKLLLSGPVINKLTDNEVKHIILHELSHLKRMDIVTKWIMTVIQIIHWFNPIVWYSFYRMDQDCEVACDAKALNYIETKDHKQYGFTIIKLIEIFSRSNYTPGTLGIVGNKSNIKRRIEMISIFNKNSWKWAITGIVVFAALGVVGLTSSIQPVQAIGESQQEAKASDSNIVTFPDHNLEKVIRQIINKPTGNITQKDVEEITQITGFMDDEHRAPTDYGQSEAFEKISSLEGIQYLTNLTKLELSALNKINDFTPLCKVVRLKELYLGRLEGLSEDADISYLNTLTNLNRFEIGKIEDITILENLTNLTKVYIILDKDNIKDINVLMDLPNLTDLTVDSHDVWYPETNTMKKAVEDISFIKDLTNLTNLKIFNSSIKDVNFLQTLTKLTKLDINAYNLSDISAIRHLTNLTELGIESDIIANIDVLKQFTNLTNLKLRCMKVSDISVLEGLTKLEKLDLSSYKVGELKDITVLKNLTNLTSLNLSNNKIDDISSLEYLTNLTNLNLGLSYNINDEDLSSLKKLSKLTNLSISSSDITDLSLISSFPKLTSLQLGYNKIIDISPLKNLTNLTYLGLQGNQIKNIRSLENLTNLIDLRLEENQIKDISPLENLTNLTYLGLKENMIKDISPLENLTNLTYLGLKENMIKDISPLVNHTNLTHLKLQKNQIKDISPLENLTNLTYLELEGNPILDYSPVDNLNLD